MAFGISGACRREEMYNLTTDDVHDNDSLFKIDITHTKTDKPRSFVISEEFHRIIKQYIDLKPKETSLKKLFIKFQNGKCYRQPVGIHKFENIPKEIATYLDLANPEL